MRQGGGESPIAACRLHRESPNRIGGPQCQAVKYSLLNFEVPDKSRRHKVVRFDPIWIGKWLHGLLDSGVAESLRRLERNSASTKSGLGCFYG